MKAGDTASMFRLPDQNEIVAENKAYSGEWLVLFFCPKDNTSGCTMEALDFSLLRELRSEAGLAVAEK